MTSPKCARTKHRQITPVSVDWIFRLKRLNCRRTHELKLCLISAHFTDEKAAIEHN